MVGRIPKIVLKNPGRIWMNCARKEVDQRNDSAETSNLNDENGTNAIWNYFRGPNGDGIYPNKAVLTDWPEKAHRFFGGNWWAESSSFAIAQDLAFSIEQQDDNEVVVIFNRHWTG